MIPPIQMDRDALSEARIDRHMRIFGPHYQLFPGKYFDVRIYRNSPCSVGASLFTVGMSAYRFPAAEGREACSFELHMLVDGAQRPEPFADVLIDISDALVERVFDTGQGITQGEVIESDALKQVSKENGYALSCLLLAWSVWLPSDYVWSDDDVLGPLAIVDAIPLTLREAENIARDRSKFEQDTSSGRIDLLDFQREMAAGKQKF